jgi:preprotein translocase subunit YajC
MSFVSPSAVFAFAPPPGGDAGSSMIPTIVMMVSVVLVMYFLIIRPQKKRADEHKKLLDSISKGDKVLTAAGIYGVVREIDDSTALIRIADNVDVRIERGSIAQRIVEKKS